MTLESSLRQSLKLREARVLMRQRQTRDSAVSPFVLVDGKSYLNFASSDYLGLANDPRVVTAFKRAADRYGVGSGAASVVSGYTAAHQALEEALADFFGYPRALVFSTGYMANIGVLTALSGHIDHVLQDKRCHASLVDGGLFSSIAFERYLHGHVADLSRRLEKCSQKRCLVVSDGVFSIDGDLAPLPEIVAKTRQFSQYLMIDDAHGIGVLGQHGKGILEHFSLVPSDIDILVGTFGKAFGTFGAFVAADHTLIEAFIQYARSYTYTTALPAAVLEATRESLSLIQSEPWRREALRELISYFHEKVANFGLKTQSFTPIQSICVGSAKKALLLGQKLATSGILVAVMRPPTTPPTKSCLRVTLTALHKKSHIDQLLSALYASTELF